MKQAMRDFPWRCGVCRERTLKPARVLYSATLQHDGRDYTVEVPDLDVLQCTACANWVLDDAANRRLSVALRAKAGLLTPEEIRERREALDLTPQQLADYLGVSLTALTYWETGVQIQPRSMDNLVRGFFDVPAYRSYLGFAEGTSAPSEGSCIDV